MDKFQAQLQAISVAEKDAYKRLERISGLEYVIGAGLRDIIKEEGPAGRNTEKAASFLSAFENFRILPVEEKKVLIAQVKEFFLSLTSSVVPPERPVSRRQAEQHRKPHHVSKPLFSLSAAKRASPLVLKKQGAGTVNPRMILIDTLPSVGSRTRNLLYSLNIKTLYDLLANLPKRYEDRSSLVPLAELAFGRYQSFAGRVVRTHIKQASRKKTRIFEVYLTDASSAMLKLVFFQNPGRYLLEKFPPGGEVMVYGKVELDHYNHIRSVVHPEVEEVEQGCEEESAVHIGRIVPVYGLTKTLSQRRIRKVVSEALCEYIRGVCDPLPEDILSELSLPARWEAFREVHFPEKSTTEELESRKNRYHQRLKFEEAFLLQLGLLLKRREIIITKSRLFRPFETGEGGVLRRLRSSLGYTLTVAQERSIQEIVADMLSKERMNRLLQGDVGSGKTIVALHALLLCLENGYQAAIMAPTEILAFQHFLSFRELLQGLGYRIAFLSSALTRKEKQEVHCRIEKGDVHLVVGTHALITQDVTFKDLGLAVIDEQHKFGVKQRLELVSKGDAPELLVMTATPIPRTMTLTLFGDLSVSLLDEMPAKRKPITTFMRTKSKKKEAYRFLKKEIDAGRQGYVVFPLVEESESLDLQAACQSYEELKEGYFSAYNVGLLHGKMRNEEKEEVMREFKRGNLDLLVATTVIEVGIDVPNATVMLIEHAERFGLSQLHQLRGRVGRGDAQSFCWLIQHGGSRDAKKRLDVMVESTDGFYIAEKDLEIRGPGDFLGIRQSGLPDLRWLNIVQDIRTLESARQAAEGFIKKNKGLDPHRFPLLYGELTAWWEAKSDFLHAG